MKYNVKRKDLEQCFRFSVEYHLDEKKLASNRTTGQYRGLGGIFDSFVTGKLIEIGVSKIISKTSGKKCNLDFGIHDLTKQNRSDPDIISVKENGKIRNPNLYVEIKNISENDRWIGLTAEQMSTIMSNSIVSNSPEKVIIIYGCLKKKTEKNLDPLGAFLKKEIPIPIMDNFCDPEDLYVEIKYILTGKDLIDNGHEFVQGSYLYETELITEAGKGTSKKILTGKNDFEKKIIKNSTLPVIMKNNYPEPKEFGKFSLRGETELYIKQNFHNGKKSSKRVYLKPKTDCLIQNKVLGNFELKKDRIYEMNFETVGMNPSLKRNNIWIAQRNLKNIIKKNLKETIEDIGKRI